MVRRRAPGGAAEPMVSIRGKRLGVGSTVSKRQKAIIMIFKNRSLLKPKGYPHAAQRRRSGNIAIVRRRVALRRMENEVY